MTDETAKRKKNANNTGSMRKRGKKWELRITIPGVGLKRFSGDTKQACREQADEVRASAHSKGLHKHKPSSRSPTLEEAMEIFLEQGRSTKTGKPWSAPVVRRIRRCMLHALTPRWRGVEADRLDPEAFQRDMGALTPVLAFEACKWWRSCFVYLVRTRRLVFNPFTTLPAIPQPRRKVIDKAYTEDEKRKLLEGSKGTRLGDILLVGFGTGLRPGELFGLQVDDLTDTGHLRIRRQRRDKPGSYEEYLKNAGSVRTIRIGEGVQAAIKRLADKEGNCVTEGRTFLAKRLEELCDSVGVECRGFYPMRHYVGTKLLLSNVPAHVVANHLGNSVVVLMRVYAHVTSAIQDEAANILDSGL